MSSTNRGEASTENWETPWWVVRRLIEEVWLPPGRWIEPCAGNGRIIQAIEEDRPGQFEWCAVETREECIPDLKALGAHTYCDDFLTWNSRAAAKKMGCKVTNERYFDVAITNPPFSKALDVISKCLTIATFVVVLQRSNWTGGGSNNGKNDFLRGCMANVYPLPDRIHFLQNGTFPRHPVGHKLQGRLMPGDSIEYSWYVWGPPDVRFQESGIIRNLQSTSLEERTTMELLPYPGYIET